MTTADQTDFVVADIAVHLAARKSRAYRQSVVIWFQTMLRFLDGNSLTTHPILGPGESVPLDFKLRRSDLTDAGFAVLKSSFQSWLRAVDTGAVEPTDDGLLRKALDAARTC
jgi:hypothetical protein